MTIIDLPLATEVCCDRIVGGMLVDIAPHLARVATFALHVGQGVDADYFVVTNVETGCRVAKHHRWSGAVRAAKTMLSTFNDASFAQVMERSGWGSNERRSSYDHQLGIEV